MIAQLNTIADIAKKLIEGIRQKNEAAKIKATQSKPSAVKQMIDDISLLIDIKRRNAAPIQSIYYEAGKLARQLLSIKFTGSQMIKILKLVAQILPLDQYTELKKKLISLNSPQPLDIITKNTIDSSNSNKKIKKSQNIRGFSKYLSHKLSGISQQDPYVAFIDQYVHDQAKLQHFLKKVGLQTKTMETQIGLRLVNKDAIKPFSLSKYTLLTIWYCFIRFTYMLPAEYNDRMIFIAAVTWQFYGSSLSRLVFSNTVQKISYQVMYSNVIWLWLLVNIVGILSYKQFPPLLVDGFYSKSLQYAFPAYQSYKSGVLKLNHVDLTQKISAICKWSRLPQSLVRSVCISQHTDISSLIEEFSILPYGVQYVRANIAKIILKSSVHMLRGIDQTQISNIMRFVSAIYKYSTPDQDINDCFITIMGNYQQIYRYMNDFQPQNPQIGLPNFFDISFKQVVSLNQGGIQKSTGDIFKEYQRQGRIYDQNQRNIARIQQLKQQRSQLMFQLRQLRQNQAKQLQAQKMKFQTQIRNKYDDLWNKSYVQRGSLLNGKSKFLNKMNKLFQSLVSIHQWAPNLQALQAQKMKQALAEAKLKLTPQQFVNFQANYEANRTQRQTAEYRKMVQSLNRDKQQFKQQSNNILHEVRADRSQIKKKARYKKYVRDNSGDFTAKKFMQDHPYSSFQKP